MWLIYTEFHVCKGAVTGCNWLNAWRWPWCPLKELWLSGILGIIKRTVKTYLSWLGGKSFTDFETWLVHRWKVGPQSRVPVIYAALGPARQPKLVISVWAGQHNFSWSGGGIEDGRDHWSAVVFPGDVKRWLDIAIGVHMLYFVRQYLCRRLRHWNVSLQLMPDHSLCLH